MTIPYFKAETTRSKTGESELTKTKTGTPKSSLYSISSGVRGKLSSNSLETENAITRVNRKVHHGGFRQSGGVVEENRRKRCPSLKGGGVGQDLS